MLDNTAESRHPDSELKLDFGFALNRIDIRTRMQVVFKLINWQRDGLFLDCGCGVGPLTKALADLGKRAVGIDIDPKAVKVASSQIARGSFLVADATHLPFRDEVFCHIVCSAVLEHIQRDKDAFLEMQRTLKTHGELAITTPRQRHSKSDARFLKKVEERFGHVREGYTLDQIKLLVKDEKLHVLKVKLYWGPAHWLMLNLFERLPSTTRRSLKGGMNPDKKKTAKEAMRSRILRAAIFLLTWIAHLDDLPIPSSHRFGMAVLMEKH